MAVIANGPSVSTVTGATGGVFNVIAGEPGAGAQATLNLPGSGKFNGQYFKVRASGLVTLTAGTYTATVQPLLYASTVAGYTASAAAAIYTPTAYNVTVASASTTKVPWTVEVSLEGDSTSGQIHGTTEATYYNGAAQLVALAAISNAATVSSVNFATEPPVQFAIGCTLGGATTGAGSTSALSQWAIMAD
jgi:hypothetical protein